MGIELHFANCKWGVGDIELHDQEGNPISGKLFAVTDPESGITVQVPLSQDKADDLAMALKSGVVPMGAMTPEQMRKVGQG